LAAPKQIIELVERFEDNIDEYRAGRYNETELRRDFVDPFFKALGWDVDNKRGYPEMYREVVHEDEVKVKGSTKAPDYGFYLGGVRKFFVEAKKPSVNLENDVRAAFQLRSYAWSANLPISILTDFEEFALYDCRVEPSNSDSPKIARLKHFTYDKYVDNWDRIEALFSRDAVLNGSLDKYIESTRRRKNTLTVDEAFLREIDHWREILVKNIHLNNSELTIRQLNSAVQNTIDRIVFLRICEDRGIEKDGRLKALLNGEKSIYTMLCEQFQQADEKYNSGLFYFKKESFRNVEPDELALCLNIDDAVLKEVIEDLYPPKSPYRFSVIPADILGHVYEQFLGKVIRLTEDHQIEVEYKPEVRKAGGVYYTPTYIVDYIVENTVGKLLEGNTPNSASELRILDPACGSGSFLIGAYQYLLDWHLKWYIDHILPLLKVGKTTSSKAVKALLSEDYNASTKKRERVRPKKGVTEPTNHFPIYEVKTDEWRLTTAERKRILLNNIYGVDIDHQATEVTKLSLQLKVLEGENEGTITKQLKISQERALPDLGANIKCGNSLIGNDFPQRKFCTEDEMYRINLFEWKTEFSEVFKDGGFDAVIGNPPYIQIQKLKAFYPDESLFYQSNYETAKEKNVDIYVPFIEQGLSLLKKDGVLGYICPNRFFNSDYGILLRQYLKIFDIYHLVNFRHYFVFKNANTYTCLLFIQKKKQQNKLEYKEIRNLYKNKDEIIGRYLNTYHQSKDNLVIDNIEPNFTEQEKWYFMTKKERKIVTIQPPNQNPFFLPNLHGS
jgi:predicted type IV restriction endonuclease